MENLTQWCTQSVPFFPKSGHFFWFSKRAGEISPLLTSCTHVSVAEYASISLNIPKHPWKRLYNLFRLCQGSEYTWSSYMFDLLLKMPPVLNKPGFSRWHGCICKGYAEFQICQIMAPFTSIMLEYASVCFNAPHYAWIWLNISEYPWICLKMPG